MKNSIILGLYYRTFVNEKYNKNGLQYIYYYDTIIKEAAVAVGFLQIF